MQFEEHAVIAAPVGQVFSLYVDVAGWSRWDQDVKSASIQGEFVSGARGTLQPTQGPKANIIFTEVVPNRSFTVESKLPLCVMRFEHELMGNTAQTKVVHRVLFKGILAPLFGRLIGNQIRKGLPHTLQGLKRAAEQG